MNLSSFLLLNRCLLLRSCQRDAGVCEISEISIPVVEDSVSLRGAPEQEAASSKPTILLMMMVTEPEVVVVSPKVELVDPVVQIRDGPEKCINNAGGFEREEREGILYDLCQWKREVQKVFFQYIA